MQLAGYDKFHSVLLHLLRLILADGCLKSEKVLDLDARRLGKDLPPSIFARALHYEHGQEAGVKGIVAITPAAGEQEIWSA
jgi:hypothetical protein